MGGPKEGGCQCGAVRYRIEAEPLGLVACHCTECQRLSGSAFGMSLAVPKDSFRLLSGELKTFTRSCDSGRTLDCSFCPNCGTRIHHAGAFAEAALTVKPGTLDDTSWLAPEMHIWTKSKQPWVPIPEGARCFDGEPGQG